MKLIDKLTAQVRRFKADTGTLPTVLRISPDMLDQLMHEARPYFSGCSMRFYPSRHPLGLTVDMVETPGTAEVIHDPACLGSQAADSFLDRATGSVVHLMNGFMKYWAGYFFETRHGMTDWRLFEKSFNARLQERGSNYRMLTD